MESILSLLNAITKSINNPILSLCAAIATVGIWYFIQIKFGIYRKENAQENKDKAKAESNSTLEKEVSKSDSSIRNKLKNLW